MKINTKKIVLIGLFSSISFILTRFLSFYLLPSSRVGFGDIPIMLSGIILGPISGAITGIISDLIGVVLVPAPSGAPYFPGFTITKALVGIIPALIYRYFKGSDKLKLVLSVVFTELICSVTLDTLWLSMLFNKGVMVILPARILVKLIIIPIEISIMYILLKGLVKSGNLDMDSL